jgi:hypothetical protein
VPRLPPVAEVAHPASAPATRAAAVSRETRPDASPRWWQGTSMILLLGTLLLLAIVVIAILAVA